MTTSFFTKIQNHLVSDGFELSPVSDIEYAYVLTTEEHLVARGAMVHLRSKLEEFGYYNANPVSFMRFIGELWVNRDRSDTDIALLYLHEPGEGYTVMVKYWWQLRGSER